MTTPHSEEFVIVLHGNAKEGLKIKNANGIYERVEKGLLVRCVYLYMKFYDVEEAKEYARKVWKKNRWPGCKKHIMIKQNLKILFEAHGK